MHPRASRFVVIARLCQTDKPFGTLHGHSNWSIDAFGIGNTSLGPEGIRVRCGDRVTHLNGAEVQLSQPLISLCSPIR